MSWIIDFVVWTLSLDHRKTVKESDRRDVSVSIRVSVVMPTMGSICYASDFRIKDRFALTLYHEELVRF